MPSAALRLAVRSRKGGDGTTLEALAAAFRRLPVPVIGRIHDAALWLDLRCLEAAQEEEFTGQLAQLQLHRDAP